MLDPHFHVRLPSPLQCQLMSVEAILRRISLFDSVEEKALPELAQCLESIQLDAGRILFYENDPGDCFFIIVEGNLEIIKAFGSPEERLLKDLGSGKFIGEMSMFGLEGRRSATVRAGIPTTLLNMNHDSFRALLHRQPDLALEVTRQLSLRLRNTDNEIIRGLQDKNRQLAAAYAELQAAQIQLIEK